LATPTPFILGSAEPVVAAAKADVVLVDLRVVSATKHDVHADLVHVADVNDVCGRLGLPAAELEASREDLDNFIT
jgi:hypothetical protein